MDKIIINGDQFIILIAIICFMLTVGWITFFIILSRNKEKIKDILSGSGFIQNLTVIGVVIIVGCLAIGGIFSGELCAAILSGISGYILGSSKSIIKKSSKSQ
ncbi:MAG: hypothetical protein RAP70_00440 [Candidatus Celaenobacter antarcticus]|nr:hypothetical protein [Candidatus Celaenobacter antarcticus]